MYMPTSLGQGQGGGDCSGWERDQESFGAAVAKHYVRTVMGKSLPVNRMTRVTPTAWRVDFPGNVAIYLTFAKIPDFVAAARWYPKPAGPSRFYTYSCTPGGQLVLSERKQP